MSIRFALIGTGWRAGFYANLARRMPERYEMTGVLAHSPAGREKAEQAALKPACDRAG